MVDHDQKRIKLIRKREISDKITGDLLEQVSGGGTNGSEGWNGGMSVRLVSLASRTLLYVLVYKRCEAGPPKLRGDKLAGLKVTWVASSFMIVAVKKDRLPKGGIGRNVNTSFVGENAFGILPVRQAGAESWRD